ncbi:MAG: hypothetical protein H6733_05030 [Alphaproteobacteria bacterium]|nr:hypothetical protein [Alphaproteobacteria bacterium]
MRSLMTSWSLVKASWKILADDATLLLLPLLSSLALLLVSVTMFTPYFAVEMWMGDEGIPVVLSYLFLFVFYFVQYTVMVFFNAALVSVALLRLNGDEASVQDGLAVAFDRIVPILGYAAFAATVGVVFRILRERLGALGRSITMIGGLALNIASFLVVPVLVTQDLNPLAAVKESASMLKRTWGENLVANAGIASFFGIVSMIVIVPMAAAAGFAWVSGHTAVAVLVGGGAVVAGMGIGVIQSALSGIFSAAVYRYAKTGRSDVFDVSTIQQAFKTA